MLMAEKIFDWVGALLIVGVVVWLIVVQSGHGTPAGGAFVMGTLVPTPRIIARVRTLKQPCCRGFPPRGE